MTPLERKKVQELQRQLVGEAQLADKLYAALVHGGFDNVWWALQDYHEARGRQEFKAPKTKKAARRKADNELKMQTWRVINCKPFYPPIEPNQDEQQ
ncbi:MAG: hypothetical protein ACO3VO_08940 [Ilumatobacteraceae bacterium]|jgi:hypothetical protein